MKKLKYILLFCVLLSVVILSCNDDDILTGPTPTPSAEMKLISPANNAVDVSINTIFRWNKNADARSYEIYVAEDSLFQNVKYFFSLTDTSTTLNIPEYGKPYYWKINYIHKDNSETFSAVWKFTTIDKIVITLVSPSNGSIFSNSKVNLKWSCNTKSLNFTVILADDSLFTTGSKFYDSKDSVLALENLSEKKYYWKVRGEYFGELFESSVRSFNVLNVSLKYPSNNALNIPSKPFFNWNNCEGVTSYAIFIATDNEFKNILCHKNNIYQIYFGDKYLQYPLDFHLEPNKKYFWTIHAYLVNGDSVIYPAWSFTTMPFYASGKVTITSKGTHYLQSGDSTVITNIIGGEVSVTYSPYFLSFIDNVYHMNDYLLGNNAYNNSADINFADGCTKINSGTFNVYSRSIGGANGMTYSGWKFEIKDIPFIYENEYVFRYMVTGEDCAKYFVKYESSWLDWNGKGGQYLESKWDKDSYIMIEFKK